MEIIKDKNAIPYSCNRWRDMKFLKTNGVCIIEASVGSPINGIGLVPQEEAEGVQIVSPCTLGTDRSDIGYCLMASKAEKALVDEYGLIKLEK